MVGVGIAILSGLEILLFIKYGDRGNRTLTIVKLTDFLFTAIFIAVIKTCKMDSIFTLVLLF